MFFQRSCRFVLLESWRYVPMNKPFLNSSRIELVRTRNMSNGGELSDDTIRKMRLFKRIGAGILFSVTLGLAIYSKRNKAKWLKDCMEDCERLPPDPDYTSSMGTEFYRCKSCIFPGDIVKSRTLKQLESLELKSTDVVVASFPKSGLIIPKLNLQLNFFINNLIYFFLKQEQLGCKKLFT